MERRKFEERKFSFNRSDSDDSVSFLFQNCLGSEVGFNHTFEKKENDLKTTFKDASAVDNNNSGAKKKMKFEILEGYAKKVTNKSNQAEQNKTEKKTNESFDKYKYNEKDIGRLLNERKYDRRDESSTSKSDRDRNDERDRYKKKEKDEKSRSGVQDKEKHDPRVDKSKNGERERDRSRDGERQWIDKNRERRDEPRVVREATVTREHGDSEKRDENCGRNDDRNRRGDQIGRNDSNGVGVNNDKPVEEHKQLPKWNPFINEIITKNNNNHESSGRQTPIFKKHMVSDLSQIPDVGANFIKNVIIKYREPSEARKPRKHWKFYLVTGVGSYTKLHIHRESAYLIGRDSREFVDIVDDHPSCSRRHAVLQYRLVPFTRPDGTIGKRIRPFLFDLASTNGTFLNNEKIEPGKYIELKRRAVVKFGCSTRDYILLLEDSKDGDLDDDVKDDRIE